MTVVDRLQRTGIRRLGTARSGFRFVQPGRGRLPLAERARCAGLKLPPAWVKVAISPAAAARVQAVGRDAAGRWQYVYHPAHVRRREQSKFARMLDFGRALPRLRRAVAADLRQPGLGKAPVLACVARILASCFLRPGSEEYADANGTFGLATLRREHVSVTGGVVRFSFKGKAGKLQQCEIRDARVARIVARLLEMPGRQVFKFVADGAIVKLRRAHVNQYLKEAMGRGFSAKDFRTWAGTLICACALGQAGALEGESTTARRRKVAAAVRETARHLGNTPAVCRSSYISPAVVESFVQGRVIDARITCIDEVLAPGEVTALRRCERALLELLAPATGARSARRAA